MKAIRDRQDKLLALSRNGEVQIFDVNGSLKETYPIIYGSALLVNDGDIISVGDRISEWDPFSIPIISEKPGKVKYVDLVDGQSLEEKVDDATFLSRKVVRESKTGSFKPAIKVLHDADGTSSQGFSSYPLPVDCVINVDEGQEVEPGDIVAKITREAIKTKDITGGLPRVAELFEARIPKSPTVMTAVNGIVSFGDDIKSKRRVIITDDAGQAHEYLIPKTKHLIVTEGDYVRKSDKLVDGQINLHDILAIEGPQAVGSYLIQEVQEVYRLQGVKISDKHIEVITRQMLRRVRIIDAGDTDLLPGENSSRVVVAECNKKMEEKGLKLATFEPVLLGITKAALSTDSFISAASFQETTKVLTQASISTSMDNLCGLKENVIMGRLVPAGTGSKSYRDMTAIEADQKNSLQGGDLEVSDQENSQNTAENTDDFI